MKARAVNEGSKGAGMPCARANFACLSRARAGYESPEDEAALRPCLYGEKLARVPEGTLPSGVGSFGWRNSVTLGGEPAFSHVNSFKRVNSPSRIKSR